MNGTAAYTLEPVVGLVATYEVTTGPDRTVVGVIAKVDDHDWRVLSTRYGAPEPTPGPFLTSEAAAATLLTERNH